MKSLLLFLSIFAASALFATPQVYFNYKVFQTPGQEVYVNTALQFIGGSFKYTGDGQGNLTAKVEITHIFSLNDSIVIADKYILDSPLMADSTVSDFYDMQRYKLKPGTYTYELTVKDAITGELVNGEQEIIILPAVADEVIISDVEFIEDLYKTDQQSNFTKNGYFVLPYLTNYFPPEIDKIAFYTEVYNTAKILGENEQFLLTCTIENYDTGDQVMDIFKFSRLNTATVTPSFNIVPIESLRSGDYNLVINIINKENDTISTKEIFFQRRNDIAPEEILSIADLEVDPSFRNSISRDSMPYFLGSIMPISERYEYESIRSLLKKTDTTLMEQYFFAFWKQTAPDNPYRAWSRYKRQVYYVEQLFGTQIKYGWEADRGRVHLQYGSPNAVVDRPNEPSAYPYQIWHYYRIGQRSNVRFVFYNPDLVTNDYPLLHSDMQGELQNNKWEAQLHIRDTPNTDVDNQGGSVHFGGNSNALYNGGM